MCAGVGALRAGCARREKNIDVRPRPCGSAPRVRGRTATLLATPNAASAATVDAAAGSVRGQGTTAGVSAGCPPHTFPRSLAEAAPTHRRRLAGRPSWPPLTHRWRSVRGDHHRGCVRHPSSGLDGLRASRTAAVGLLRGARLPANKMPEAASVMPAASHTLPSARRQRAAGSSVPTGTW